MSVSSFHGKQWQCQPSGTKLRNTATQPATWEQTHCPLCLQWKGGIPVEEQPADGGPVVCVFPCWCEPCWFLVCLERDARIRIKPGCVSTCVAPVPLPEHVGSRRPALRSGGVVLVSTGEAEAVAPVDR